MSTLEETVPLGDTTSDTSSESSQKSMVWIIVAGVVVVLLLLCFCRDNTPDITGITVEQAKRKLKDTEYTVGEKVGFVEPLDGNQLGKIAEQQVDKETKKIHYKMYQIDVNNIDEYARLAKEKAKQARQMAVMQSELERAMRATPPPPPPVVEEVIVEPPLPPAPIVEQPEPPRKRRVVDMGFGSTGLSVRKASKAPKDGFFW